MSVAADTKENKKKKERKKERKFSSWTSSRIKIESRTRDVVDRKLVRGPCKVLHVNLFYETWQTDEKWEKICLLALSVIDREIGGEK